MERCQTSVLRTRVAIRVKAKEWQYAFRNMEWEHVLRTKNGNRERNRPYEEMRDGLAR